MNSKYSDSDDCFNFDSDTVSETDSNSDNSWHYCERIVENTIRLKCNKNETHLKVLLKKFKFIKEIEVELGSKNITPIIETLTQSQKFLKKVVFNGVIDQNV
jgi:DNA-directed RNA polymerase beta' subunit